MEPPKPEITLEELYQIIGELEVLRRKYLLHILKHINEKPPE